MTEHWPLPGAAEERREVCARVGDDLCRRLAEVRLCVFDCDGILSPGNLIYGADGEALKEFDARDGLGLSMMLAAGIKRAVLTGRTSPMVLRRCRDLRFDAIKMDRFDKLAALEEIWSETGVDASATLYMGDDLLDLPTMAASGLAITVPDAPAEVRAAANWTTGATGGRGAVREVCDLILKARGGHGAAIRALASPGGKSSGSEVTH